MAKYLINVPDGIIEFMNGKFNFFIEPEVKVGECRHYKVRLDDTEITPYTEPDREAIENEVWEFAKKVRLESFIDSNGSLRGYISHFDTYKEAKAKYESMEKSKAKIRVGDEVETESGNKACVLYENPDGTQMFVFKADGTAAWWSKCAIHKTGKNHPEVAELLKKMGGEEK